MDHDINEQDIGKLTFGRYQCWDDSRLADSRDRRATFDRKLLTYHCLSLFQPFRILACTRGVCRIAVDAIYNLFFGEARYPLQVNLAGEFEIIHRSVIFNSFIDSFNSIIC